MEALKALLNLKKLTEMAVIMVEHPGNGPAKREKVIEIVKELMKMNDIKLPMSDNVLEIVLGFAIDNFVGWANEKLWKANE